MLSIIVCSVKPDLYRDVSAYIEQTIGEIPYELICHDNRVAKMGLPEVYNQLAEKATHENLLFLHEDVALHTTDWGQKLVTELQNPRTGLVGVVGAVYKSSYPSSWSWTPNENMRSNIIQRLQDGSSKEIIRKSQSCDIRSRVAVIDGVFLAMRKEVWQEYPFDSDNLRGFHLYDTDISVRVGQSYDVVVTHKLLLEHFSLGTYGPDWVEECVKFHKRAAPVLPIASCDVDSSAADHKACVAFSHCCMRNAVPLHTFIKSWLRAIFLKPFARESWHILTTYVRTFFAGKNS